MPRGSNQSYRPTQKHTTSKIEQSSKKKGRSTKPERVARAPGNKPTGGGKKRGGK
jgi:hypothetical protein